MATRLHPYVTSRFRVKEGPRHTSAIGSSLGGQASLQLILRYPEIFGGAACLSPCFQPGTIAAVMANLVAQNEVAADIVGRNNDEISLKQSGSRLQNLEMDSSIINPKTLHSKTIYIDNGGDVDDTRVPVFEALDHFTLNERWWVSSVTYETSICSHTLHNKSNSLAERILDIGGLIQGKCSQLIGTFNKCVPTHPVLY